MKSIHTYSMNNVLLSLALLAIASILSSCGSSATYSRVATRILPITPTSIGTATLKFRTIGQEKETKHVSGDVKSNDDFVFSNILFRKISTQGDFDSFSSKKNEWESEPLEVESEKNLTASIAHEIDINTVKSKFNLFLNNGSQNLLIVLPEHGYMDLFKKNRIRGVLISQDKNLLNSQFAILTKHHNLSLTRSNITTYTSCEEQGRWEGGVSDLNNTHINFLIPNNIVASCALLIHLEYTTGQQILFTYNAHLVDAKTNSSAIINMAPETYLEILPIEYNDNEWIQSLSLSIIDYDSQAIQKESLNLSCIDQENIPINLKLKNFKTENSTHHSAQIDLHMLKNDDTIEYFYYCKFNVTDEFGGTSKEIINGRIVPIKRQN